MVTGWPFVRSTDRLERGSLTLGYVPLTDCAPLAVAAAHGYFRDEGLSVRLQPLRSWAAVRDHLHTGLIDGAQLLAPMVLAANIGLEGGGVRLATALTLSLNGNGITLSRELAERLSRYATVDPRSPQAVARALAEYLRSEQPRRRPRLASVYPFSSHHYLLRYWLAAGGVDPDRDVELRVVPPPLVGEHLADGRIDGFCVGEPWNSAAVSRGTGVLVASGYRIWNNGQEKVLGVRREWAEAHPQTHLALVRALLRACRWLDRQRHRADAARLLADEGYVALPVADLERALCCGADVDEEDFIVFHRYAANFPWRSHTLWFARQMHRWGHLPETADVAAAASASVLPKVYRDAAGGLGLPCPDTDVKSEGRHAQPWMLSAGDTVLPMGPDRFMDGAVFEPSGV